MLDRFKHVCVRLVMGMGWGWGQLYRGRGGDGDGISGDGDGDKILKAVGTVGMGIISMGTVGDGDKSCPRAAL